MEESKENGERKQKRHKPAAQGEAGQMAVATSQPKSLPLPALYVTAAGRTFQCVERRRGLATDLAAC